MYGTASYMHGAMYTMYGAIPILIWSSNVFSLSENRSVMHKFNLLRIIEPIFVVWAKKMIPDTYRHHGIE